MPLHPRPEGRGFSAEGDKANFRHYFKKEFPLEYAFVYDETNWFSGEHLPVKLYILVNQLIEYPKCKCGKEIRRFNTSIFKFIDTCTNKECVYRKDKARERLKKMSFEKYGVTNLAQHTSVKNKIGATYRAKSDIEKNKIKLKTENTNLKKFGTKAPAQNKEVLSKIENTNLKKYNMKSVLCDKSKVKSGMLEKYGVENPMQVGEIKEKVKKTTIENHGGIGFQTDTVRNLMLEKYGVENPMQVNEIKEKVYRNNIAKYGFKSVLSVELVKNSAKKTWREKMLKKIELFETVKPNFDHNSYSGVHIEYEWVCKKCNSLFLSNLEDGKYPKCPICFPYIKSKEELNIKSFIESLGFEVFHNKKPFGSKFELDLYIPEKKLAIEYNGLYWHSDSKLKKHYHKSKTDFCIANGVQLLHIFEHQWLNSQELIKSMLASKLNVIKTKIFARKCELKVIITPNVKNIFLSKNHLQGEDESKIQLGLYFKNELVAVMTFGTHRANSKYEWELLRYANKLHTTVIGGMSKLFTYFIKNYNPMNVITYADRTYSDGNSYYVIGFKQVHISSPNFWVFGNDKVGVDSKHKLQQFNQELSAWENMKNSGYSRYWDAGNIVLKWTK